MVLTRVQTLLESTNPRVHRLLMEYKKLTGYSMLLNTSFNLKDQTMVRNSEGSIDTFMKCDMDYLILGNLFLTKKDYLTISLQFLNTGIFILKEKL